MSPSPATGPLNGLTVAVTASRRATELASLIENMGGRPYIAPTVGIEAEEDVSKEVEAFTRELLEGDVDYAVFMTGPGVYALMSAARSLGLGEKLVASLRRVIVVARSAKPSKALAEHGIKAEIVPEDNTAEGIAKALRTRDIGGKKVVVLWHGSYSPRLKDELKSAGADVFEYWTYRYSPALAESGAEILTRMGFRYVPPDEGKVVKMIEEAMAGSIDAITFTSPPAVRNLFRIAEAHNMKEVMRGSLAKDVIVVAVGSSTRASLEEEGIRVDVMPDVYKMGPMMKALGDYLNKADRKRVTHRGR